MHTYFTGTCISIQQNQKRQHRGIRKGKGRIIIRVTIHTKFKEYVAYCQNNIKVLSGLKFYAHLN